LLERAVGTFSGLLPGACGPGAKFRADLLMPRCGVVSAGALTLTGKDRKRRAGVSAGIGRRSGWCFAVSGLGLVGESTTT